MTSVAEMVDRAADFADQVADTRQKLAGTAIDLGAALTRIAASLPEDAPQRQELARLMSEGEALPLLLSTVDSLLLSLELGVRAEVERAAKT